MKPSKQELFKRQTTLAEIGEDGQQKLQEAAVLVVGCGGLGSPIAVNLATSGIGKIHLVDFDTIDLSNLHRQVFYTVQDVGKPKAQVLAKVLQDRAPYTTVSYTNLPINKENVFDILQDYDIIVDGTDSLPTKYVINDACVLLKKPLVYGSLYKFDGYVASFNLKQEDGSFSANLRDAFPEMATDIPNCEEAGTLNAIVGMIATMQVNEVLKLITKVGKPLVNELLVYNALQNTQLKMKLHAKVSQSEIQSLFDSESYFDVSCQIQNDSWQISADELKKRLSEPAKAQKLALIAVLPNLELPFEVQQTIPINEFHPNAIAVDPSKTYVMVCQKGLNSYKATQMMREAYPYVDVLNLSGGIANY